MKTEITDCRFCEYCVTGSSTDNFPKCYVEDGGYFSHDIKNPVKEAQECQWFEFCDVFPKW